jgi:hypothetical protein
MLKIEGGVKGHIFPNMSQMKRVIDRYHVGDVVYLYKRNRRLTRRLREYTSGYIYADGIIAYKKQRLSQSSAIQVHNAQHVDIWYPGKYKPLGRIIECRQKNAYFPVTSVVPPENELYSLITK